MEITKIVVNAKTGEQQTIVETLTDAQVAEMEKQQAISQAQNRIQEIKAKLQGMDYMSSKIIDGDYTDEEVANIKAIRNALRNEINDLEAQIGE